MLVVTAFSVVAMQARSSSTEVATETVTRAASLEKEAVVEKITNPNDVVKYGIREEALLNAAELNPMVTNDKELDEQVSDILGELINESMSNYEKVLEVYKYMETKFSYYGSFIPSDISYVSDYDNRNVGRAKGILTTGHGTCTEFSAAFMVMMRAIGLECYTVQGYYAGGPHTWAIIVLDGENYIFDPQIDFRQWQGHGGKICLSRFCMDSSFEYYDCYRAVNEQRDIDSFSGFALNREKSSEVTTETVNA
ncbi:MAG: hypothetical protein K5836_01460 [Clostridiales bacterium]|nr:hypothetical protein [Clostridiales bacterium]